MAHVRLEGVCVEFPIFDVSGRNLRHSLLNAARSGFSRNSGSRLLQIKALSEVSCEICDGDRVGLVGPNGAGKSTLLRVLSGIYEPVEGKAFIEGKVAPLLDIGWGMDPEATGYKNILILGLGLRMRLSQIRSKSPEIEEFTELGDSLSLPVRTYSTGMKLRLAFAVATSVDPEILLIDEGIGLGDQRFQKKSEERVNKLMENATILVFASHSLEMLQRYCNKGILLNHGRIAKTGDIKEVIDYYVSEAL